MIFKKMSKIGFFTYLFLCLLPIFMLVFSFKSSAYVDFSFSKRQFGLLFNTLVLALAVSVLTAIIGFFAAICIKNSSFRNKRYRWVFLLSLAIPKYVYALSMMSFIRLIEDASSLSLKGFYQGFYPSLIVEVLIFLPILTGLILVKMEGLDACIIESGLVYNSYNKVVLEIVLPSLMPVILFASSIVFALSSIDFTVPSLFQYNVYAMDIFSDFSASSSAIRALYLSLPLIIFNLLPIYIIAKFLPDFFIKNTGKKLNKTYRMTGLVKVFSHLSVIIVFLQVVVAILSLALSTNYLSSFYALRTFASEYYYSFMTAIIAICFSFVLSGLALNFYLSKYAMTDDSVFSTFALKSRGYLYLLIFLFALPSSLTAIGFSTAVNTSLFYELSTSVFMMGLGMGIKFLPFVFILFLALLSSLDRDVLDSGKMYRNSDLDYFKSIFLPMFRMGLFFIGALLFFLSFGEVDLSLILAPAGKLPISISIFNALHYGQSDIVCAKSLYLVFINLAFVFIFYTLFFRRGKYE